MATMFFKTLSGAALAASLAFGAASQGHAQGFVVETGIEALQSPATTIEGLHRLYIGRQVSPTFSFGQSIYSGALGDAGGAFFWGFEGVARLPVTERLSLGVAGFVGGGGGAAQVVGHGTMLRVGLSADYRLSAAWDLQLTSSWIRINGAPIDGPAFGLGLRYRMENGRLQTAASGVPEFSSITGTVSYMIASSDSRRRGGAAQPNIALVGARADFDLTPQTRLTFGAAGGAMGAQGYMQITAGLRRNFEFRNLSFFVEGGAGLGGGGHVDSGAGLLLQAGVGVSVPVTRSLDAELALGAVAAPDGQFQAARIALGFSRNFGRVRAMSDGRGERWAFSAGFSVQRVNAPNYWQNPGTNPNTLVAMQETSFDYFVSERFYLTGNAQTTVYGGVAGFAIGMVGLGYELPLADRWSLSLEAHIGAAGGGGVETSGGLIGGLRAELDYHATDTWRLSMGVGQIRTLRAGGMSPLILTLGAKIPFTTHH